MYAEQKLKRNSQDKVLLFLSAVGKCIHWSRVLRIVCEKKIK